MTQTRRDFLKIAAMLSGSASVSGFVPESIKRAFAIEPEPGSTYMDAEHIVILMQENRSFDHALGTLQGVRGFNDPRSISGDLTSVFRPHEAKEAKLDFLDRDKFVVSIQQAQYKEIPSNYRKLSQAQIEEFNSDRSHSQSFTHQEKGIRQSCSLPYELYADGSLNSDLAKFELHMKAGNEVHGRRSAGAPFNVYLRNTHGDGAGSGKGMMVATYAVKPGDTLREEFPLSLFADARYSIDVHGPNGFYRSFTGDSHVARVQVHTAYERKASSLTGNVEVRLHNSGERPLTVSVHDNAYGTAPVIKTIAAKNDASIVLYLKRSYGWYDFTVKTEGSQFESRHAGRVETGRSSFSDPLMGGVV
jgi:phospholipase C